jgi:hypothetical protein
VGRSGPLSNLAYHLPDQGGATFYVDLATLRRDGLLDRLAGSRSLEESEYRAFVMESGFEYRTDLDEALGTIKGKEQFLLLRGRFQWSTLQAFVERMNGRCRNSFCSLPATTPGFWISMFPLRSDVMAIAHSKGSGAAYAMYAKRERPRPDTGSVFWMQAGQATIQQLASGLGSALPADSLRRVDMGTLRLGLKGLRLEASLNLEGANDADGARISSEAASLLGGMQARAASAGDPQPLLRFLASGSVQQEGSRVNIVWPVDPVELDRLASMLQ